MTPSDLPQILSRCALRFSHFIGFNDSVSCKSVSYKKFFTCHKLVSRSLGEPLKYFGKPVSNLNRLDDHY